jgi:hypothetical protein
MVVLLDAPAKAALFAAVRARTGKQRLLEVGDQADQPAQRVEVADIEADVDVEAGRAVDLGADAVEPIADGLELAEAVGTLEDWADDLGRHVAGAGHDGPVALGLPARGQLRHLGAVMVAAHRAGPGRQGHFQLDTEGQVIHVHGGGHGKAPVCQGVIPGTIPVADLLP